MARIGVSGIKVISTHGKEKIWWKMMKIMTMILSQKLSMVAPVDIIAWTALACLGGILCKKTFQEIT